MSAIIRREMFAGAKEGYCLPGGEYVIALNEAAVLTDTGRIPCPEPLRYPVMTVGTSRGRCIAAQGASEQSRSTWEYVAEERWTDDAGQEHIGRWFDRGPNGGERPTMYLQDGTLVIEPGGPNHPTEGWAGASLDGQPMRIVRYDQARDIHERTIVGPLVIGQSSIDGIEIQFDGHRYQAEPGDTHTIWAVLQGNVLALATRKLAQNETVLLWVDINRLSELPPAPVKKPPVIVVPPIVDPPIIVPPKEPHMHVPNRAGELAHFHQIWNGAKAITDLDEKHRFTTEFVKWMNAAEEEPEARGRYGRKSRAGSPGIVSKDTIAFWLGATIPAGNADGQIDAVDIIGSDGSVSWDTRAEQGDPGYQNIYALWMPVDGAVVEPPQPEPDLSKQVAELKAKYEAVRLAIDEAKGVNEQQARALTEHGNAIEELKKRPSGGGSPDLSGLARKGDPVTVRGRIPILGNVTVRGEIDA